MIAFLRTQIGQYVLIGLAILALVVGIYSFGHHAGEKSEQRAEAARLATARKAVAKREVKAQAISEHVAADVSKARTEIQYRTKTLVKEVPVYVTVEADRACTVPVGFVRLHDAAASGSPPGVPSGAGGPNDAASGVQLSAVLSTVVGNYGVAYDWRAEALGWRDWYVKEKAAWDAR